MDTMLRVRPQLNTVQLTPQEETHLAAVIDLGTETIEGMGDLKDDSLFLDVMVRVGSKEFMAHKAFLAAVSQEFRRRISEAKPEEGSTMVTVELEDISEEGAQMVMDFLYEQKIEVTQENLEKLLQASIHLDIDSLIATCCNFMMNMLSKETYIRVLTLPNKYSLVEIHREVLSFISECWKSLPDSLVHMAKEDLLTVLGSVSQCESEAEVFSVAKKWVEADPERLTSAGDVMTAIKFPLMSEEELAEVIASTPFLLEEPNCLKLMNDARDYHKMKVNERVIQTNKRTKVRGDPCHVVFFTGLNPPIPSNDFFVPYILDISSNLQYRWISLPSVPEALGASTVAVINNFLVACGVGTITDRTEKASVDCAIFDPRTHGWATMSPMKYARVDFPLVNVGDNLYAIGGSSKWLSPAPIAFVEAYSFQDDKWFEVAPLPDKRTLTAACEYGGKIYVSGGIREDKSVSQDMWVYDTNNNEWSEMPKLLQPEQNHLMLPLMEGHLTLISGESGKVFNFSFETNQWNQVEGEGWSQELTEKATVINYTPSLNLIAWQNVEKKSDENEAAAGDSNLKTEICHQPLQYVGEGVLKTRWCTTRVLDFPEGVYWRHCTLMTLPWKTLCQGKLELRPEEDENMMLRLLRQISKSCEEARTDQDQPQLAQD